jgi:hypothetical protein
MSFHKHVIDRTSFSVEILSEYMDFKEDLINQFVATMTNKRMGVNIGESKIPVRLEKPDHIPYLIERLGGIHQKELEAGTRFVEQPEIISVPERSMLVHDGLTSNNARIITFLAVTSVNKENWFASVRGYIPEEAELTKAFILSVSESFRSKEF